MKKYFKLIFGFFLFLLVGCNNDKKIFELLASEDKEDIILGAYKAGESGDKKFVPALLKNADDKRSSTNIRFMGMTVYQAKMGALKKIFNSLPPNQINYKPDSTIIKFYIRLSQTSLNQ